MKPKIEPLWSGQILPNLKGMLQYQLTAAVIAFVLLISALESYFPDQTLPQVPFWWQRVTILQVLVFFTVNLGLFLFEDYFHRVSLFSLKNHMGAFQGGVFSYLLGTFLFYWWHRWRHEFDSLWLAFHQMHHSPARIQAATAFYVHPLEVVASSLVNALLVFVILGLSKDSLVWNSTLMSIAGTFYHMNLKTPVWVGYFIQRPEMHRYHHELNIHGRNYGDVPWWDMLFGTHFNPPTFSGLCGFADQRELRFTQILRFVDVNSVDAVRTQDNFASCTSESPKCSASLPTFDKTDRLEAKSPTSLPARPPDNGPQIL